MCRADAAPDMPKAIGVVIPQSETEILRSALEGFSEHHGQDRQRVIRSLGKSRRGFCVKTENVAGSILSIGSARHASEVQIEVAVRISGDPSRARGDPD